MPIQNILHEEPFEKYITSKLKDAGWEVSQNDEGFNPHEALFEEDFFRFLENYDAKKLGEIKQTAKDKWRQVIKEQLIKGLESKGTAWTLQNGFPLIGVGNIDCSAKYPDVRSKDGKRQYQANILRVMRQVHYQTAGNKSLDLVFFVNGIPVATGEVKTENTQTVKDAIKEYQRQRKPIEPGTRRKNYLLMPKRGAIVHFAISEDEIWMCTNLDSDKPKFLPFNIGNEGHAGNPKIEGDYSTSYLWKQICQKDNWLRIFHNFVFNEEFTQDDGTGRLQKVSKFIFPRFHQWDCVTKVLEDVKLNGAGQKYLIEHSAGSGKTQTISWIAHDLADLHDMEGNKVFSSVIIVTDRVSLDNNIKKTIWQLRKKKGQIVMVGNPEERTNQGYQSKSKQLAKAIVEKREIIVVTVQTFLFAWLDILKTKTAEGNNFAVIIDEAHSSQTGSNATAMHKSLADITTVDNSVGLSMLDEDVNQQDKITEFFLKEQKSRLMPKNVSFLAFTATPKSETKTLFGRTPVETDDKEPVPQSFHLYPMRQAIEEGYILDPLTGYLPYSTAYKIAEKYVKDSIVDEGRAKRKIAKCMSLHPTNVMAKTAFIIEHFANSVASLLGGEAKAMIVTSSRAAVIRYKYAIDAYLKANPKYDRSKIEEHLQFKVPGTPLVAFSGTVRGDQCIVTEGAMMEDTPYADIQKDFGGDPFAAIKADHEYTEANMNNLDGYGSVEKAFEDTKNNLLIVANKFQTGYDQPKLCAMYIDKPLANDIEVVQTYSRVNRVYPGKDELFIIDFYNDQDKVLAAFKKYDTGAVMESPQDPYAAHNIKQDLDQFNIYFDEDVKNYGHVKGEYLQALMNGELEPKEEKEWRLKLYNSVDAPYKRWREDYLSHSNAVSFHQRIYQDSLRSKDENAIKEAKDNFDKAVDELNQVAEFKKKLQRYVKLYHLISQVVFLGDPDLEVFNGFAKLLAHRLNEVEIEDIDLGKLVLVDYKINELDLKTETPIEGVLRPMGPGSTKHSKRESLKIIVQHLNEIWGSDINLVEGARAINFLTDHVLQDPNIRQLINNSTNSKEAVINHGRLKSLIQDGLLALIENDLAPLAEKALKDPQSTVPLAEAVYDQILNRTRYEIDTLRAYLQKSSSGGKRDNSP